MPSDPDRKRFFIALLPPIAIQNEANSIKQYFADRYHSRAAQKSPPHITLQPPFEWSTQALPRLEQALATFALNHWPIPLTLEGFASFPPRVIFINVHHTPELLALQHALKEHAHGLGIESQGNRDRPFRPHLTVAFRDLTKQNFHQAWPEFQHRSDRYDFIADRLTLLIHDGIRWNICREFPFAQRLEE